MKREEVIEIAKKHHVNSEHTEFGWQECDRYELDIEELTAFIAEIERRTLERAAPRPARGLRARRSTGCASLKAAWP